MKIILKHTLNSVRRNWLQVVIVVITVTIITTAIFVAFSAKDVFGAYEESWLRQEDKNSDVYIFSRIPDLSVSVYEQYGEYVEYTVSDAVSVSIYLITDDIVINSNFILCDTETLLSADGSKVVASAENTENMPYIVISTDVAKRLNVWAGDTIKSHSNVYVYIYDLFVKKVVESVGTFSTINKYSVAIDTYNVAREQTRYHTYIYLKDPNALMPDGETLVRKSIIDTISLVPEVEVVIDATYTELVETNTARDNGMFALAMAVVIVAVCFILLSAYSIIVNTRIDEIVKFKAAGATPTQCTLIMLVEVILYAIIGGAVGLSIGTVIYNGVINLLYFADNPLLALSFVDYLVSFVVCIGVTCLACLYPIIKMSRHSIRLLLSDSADIRKKNSIAMAIISTVILVASVLLMVFAQSQLLTVAVCLLVLCVGVWLLSVSPYIIKFFAFLLKKIFTRGEQNLASRAVVRSKKINTVVVITSAIIGCIWLASCLINVATIVTKTQRERYSFNAIFGEYFSSGRHNDMNAIIDICEEYADEVTIYTNYSLVLPDEKDVRYNNYNLVLFDEPTDITKVSIDIDQETLDKFCNTPHGAIVGYEFAYENDIKIGDEITPISLNVYTYMGEPLIVVGYDYSILSWNSVVYAHPEDIVFYYGNTVTLRHYYVGLTIDEELIPQCQKDILDAGYSDYILYVEDYYIDAPIIERMVQFISVVKILLLAIVILGLSNTTLAAGSNRKKEMGVYKKVGMTLGGAVRMSVTEGIVIFLSSLLFGVGLSTLFNAVCHYIAPSLDYFSRFTLFPINILWISIGVAAITCIVWVVSSTVRFAIERRN